MLSVLERIPRRSQLLVINYHRIGRRAETPFDPEVFSVDQEVFDAQVGLLKRSYGLVDEAEALDIVAGRSKPQSTAVLLTFDDGYRDNLTLAVPVLKAHGAKAIFFLVTGYLENPAQIPWWDRIAWLVRGCEGKVLELSQPEPWSILVDKGDIEHVIARVLSRFRSPLMMDAELFFAELERCSDRGQPAQEEPLLMGWDDARRLREEGMDVGLHTHSHEILAKLDAAGQARELAGCKDMMRREMGYDASTLAYPVGSHGAFTPVTKQLAQEAGFSAAFSFYGGTNPVGAIDPFDVKRVSFAGDTHNSRSRAAVALMATSGSIWF